MSELRIHLFGYPNLFVDDQPVLVERRKSLALAAYLALETGSDSRQTISEFRPLPGCSREVLAAMFWPEASQQQAGAYLRQALWDLARSIGESWVVREGQSIRLNSQEKIWVDVIEFEIALEGWKAGTTATETAANQLTQVVSLYRGDFLAGFSLRDSPAFDGWQTEQAELLRLHLAQILEMLVNYHLRLQAYDTAMGFAQHWLELDHLDETAHRAMMQIYFRTDQAASAIRQYQRCCEVLSAELGVQPAEETVALFEQIRERSRPISKPKIPGPVITPTGTVTFLFSDIEGSTRLWENHPAAMQVAFKRQETIMRKSMLSHGGYVYKMVGDAFQVAFSTAEAGLTAAIEAQRSLHAENWGEIGEIKIRMALHTGVTEERGDDYVGPELNRVARIMGAGHGGQVLLSHTTVELIRDHLPQDVSLLDLGEWRLRDIENPERIYQVQAPGLLTDFPSLRTVDVPTYNLPVMATPFIGRKQELEQIDAMLSSPDCRLITLVGIGGTGKTRLAIQAASQIQANRNQACFVPLAACHSVDEMIIAIAHTLDFKFQILEDYPSSNQAMQSQLIQHLTGRSLLMVLDNFEQLVDCSEFVAALLQATSKLKLIITSRERTNLPGEWVLEVLGLAFPSDMHLAQAFDYPAVQLFMSSAQRVSNARLTSEDPPAVIRICQMLEGVPLGIEMAASWVKMLSCAEIAAEIEKDLDFLTASWRGMPERHRTLRAVFEHSWLLLGDRDRDGFICLAVFRGGFSRQAAWEVAGVPILLLATLTDKSFLRRVYDGRYEIHPVLRGYVYEKLAEDAVLLHKVEGLHARYFSRWMSEMTEALKGSMQLSALAALRAEMHNLQSALQWLVDQQAFDILERVLPGLVLFSTMNDQRVFTQKLMEILCQLQGLLEFKQQHLPLLALVYAILFYYATYPLESEKSSTYRKRSLELFSELPDSSLKAYGLALTCIGPSYSSPSQILEMGQACLKLFMDLKDEWGKALLQLLLGDIYNYGLHHTSQARFHYEASSRAFTKHGNQWGRSLCYYGLMDVARDEGNLEQAYEYGYKAKILFELLDNSQRNFFANHELALIARQQGKIKQVQELIAANIGLLTHQGDKEGLHNYQVRLAQLGLDFPVA